MSSMAKIFVVVNLVLAVMTFGSAATLLGAQDDYKAALDDTVMKFDEYKAAMGNEVDNLESQVATQTTKASTAVADKANAEENLATAQRELASAKEANVALKNLNDTLAKELGGLRQNVDTFRQAVERMTDENKSNTATMVDARNKYQTEVQNRVRLEQEVAQQQETIVSMTAEKGDMQRRIRQLEFWVEDARKKGWTEGGASQGASGKVLMVRTGDFGVMVSVSVGSEDGVRRGDIYHIRRGSSYVGQMQIDRVEKSQAVGLFDTEYVGPASPPQAGDIAYPEG